MGNIDKVVIFNQSFALLVKGSEYKTPTEVIAVATKKFEENARASIAAFYAAKERDPQSVEPSYRPEDELEISGIQVYDLHN